MLLLQNAAFVTLFRGAAGKLSDARVDQITATPGEDGIAGIFNEAGHDRPSAARKALAYLDGGGEVEP